MHFIPSSFFVKTIKAIVQYSEVVLSKAYGHRDTLQCYLCDLELAI